MVCDLVVADETARFGTPEAAVGLLPGPGVVRGRSNLTLHALKYMIFTGAVARRAAGACAAGLVNEVVPAGEHLARAAEWADTIAQKAPLALATAKALLSAEGWERSPHVVDAVAMLQGSEDFARGHRRLQRAAPAAVRGSMSDDAPAGTESADGRAPRRARAAPRRGARDGRRGAGRAASRASGG